MLKLFGVGGQWTVLQSVLHTGFLSKAYTVNISTLELFSWKRLWLCCISSHLTSDKLQIMILLFSLTVVCYLVVLHLLCSLTLINSRKQGCLANNRCPAFPMNKLMSIYTSMGSEGLPGFFFPHHLQIVQVLSYMLSCHWLYLKLFNNCKKCSKYFVHHFWG